MTAHGFTAGHTPGPWKRNKWGELVGSNGKQVQLANSGACFVSGFENPEAVANSALLHAAPDLLAELQLILEWALIEKAPLREQEIGRIRELIAAATRSRG